MICKLACHDHRFMMSECLEQTGFLVEKQVADVFPPSE